MISVDVFMNIRVDVLMVLPNNTTHMLVYAEEYASIMDAIKREKQIKSGSRSDKIHLIQSVNPQWNDLSKT
jgi:predicted GIY-YIG superfamily endonuclease